MPSVVQFENLENQIYQCAPKENNIPKYILLDNDFKELTFPDLFQYGGGGYHSTNTKVKLPIRKYFQQCLLNVCGRFDQNIEYLFCALYIADIKQIETDATLAIMLSQGRTLGGHKITAGQLWNPDVLELERNEQAYKFLKNVRGSPAYWQDDLYDALAMLWTLSIPTWFLMLSAADLNQPEMIQAVAVQFGKKLSWKNVLKMSIADRSRHLHQNPRLGCECFNTELRRSSLNTFQWCTPTRPYYRLCDENERITPCPLVALGKRCPKNWQRSRWCCLCFHWQICNSSYTSSSTWNEHHIKLMDNLQKHTHLDYHHRNNSCYFGFPKSPATKTLISRPPVDDHD